MTRPIVRLWGLPHSGTRVARDLLQDHLRVTVRWRHPDTNRNGHRHEQPDPSASYQEDVIVVQARDPYAWVARRLQEHDTSLTEATSGQVKDKARYWASMQRGWLDWASRRGSGLVLSRLDQLATDPGLLVEAVASRARVDAPERVERPEHHVDHGTPFTKRDVHTPLQGVSGHSQNHITLGLRAGWATSIVERFGYEVHPSRIAPVGDAEVV